MYLSSSCYGNVSGHTTIPPQLPVCIHTTAYPAGGVRLLHTTDPAGHVVNDGPREPDGPIDPDGPCGGDLPILIGSAAQLADVDAGPIDPLEPVLNILST